MKYKFLIILFYYNRPQMVKNALLSIKYSDFYYDNWKLLFVDDGSPLSGKEILYEILRGCENKIEYINTNSTEEIKFDLGGSLIGKYANDELQKTDCDYAIMLCDDDALYPQYLYNLNDHFNKNSNDISVYCKNTTLVYPHGWDCDQCVVGKNIIEHIKTIFRKINEAN